MHLDLNALAATLDDIGLKEAGHAQANETRFLSTREPDLLAIANRQKIGGNMCIHIASAIRAAMIETRTIVYPVKIGGSRGTDVGPHTLCGRIEEILGDKRMLHNGKPISNHRVLTIQGTVNDYTVIFAYETAR